MILRKYKKEDSPIIATWLRTEEELYKWSSDRFNKFPLEENDIEENYAPQLGAGRLLRTYVSSAVSALEKAEFIEL